LNLLEKIGTSEIEATNFSDQSWKMLESSDRDGRSLKQAETNCEVKTKLDKQSMTIAEVNASPGRVCPLRSGRRRRARFKAKMKDASRTQQTPHYPSAASFERS
jgi:hypothetical protein